MRNGGVEEKTGPDRRKERGNGKEMVDKVYIAVDNIIQTPSTSKKHRGYIPAHFFFDKGPRGRIRLMIEGCVML